VKTRMRAARCCLAILSLVLASCAGSTPSPSQPASSAATSASSLPSAAELTETFTSAIHGYAVQHPAGWTVTPATQPWEGEASANLWGSPVLDDLHGSSIRLTAASQPLSAGQTMDGWLSEYASHGACEGRDPVSWPTIPVGDEVGVMSADGCPASDDTIAPGGRLFDVIVFVDGRVYNFTLDGDLDHDLVETILSTVIFDPADASS
jgi:hypothetical protein